MSESVKERIKLDWSQSAYYDKAEAQRSIAVFWGPDTVFMRFFEKLKLGDIVDLACGHGRHSDYIRKTFAFNTLTVIDVNASNIDYCRQRFADDARVRFVVNTGSDFRDLPAASIDLIFCYDAMVHFEYDDVFSYIRDTWRVLRPGGRALFHHSNNDRFPGSLYSQNPEWRNFMSANLFSHVAMRCGFVVEGQQVIDWGTERLDCVTLLLKPIGAQQTDASASASEPPRAQAGSEVAGAHPPAGSANFTSGAARKSRISVSISALLKTLSPKRTL